MGVGARENQGGVLHIVHGLQLLQSADNLDLLPPHIVDKREIIAQRLEPRHQNDVPVKAGVLPEGVQTVRERLHRQWQRQVGDLLQPIGGGNHAGGIDGGDVRLRQPVFRQHLVVERLHALHQHPVAPGDGRILGAYRLFGHILHLKVPVQQIGPGVGGAGVKVEQIAVQCSVPPVHQPRSAAT